jgi:hypothetical protein
MQLALRFRRWKRRARRRRTLIQSLYAIRSEIERAGELLIAGKPLREVSHG